MEDKILVVLTETVTVEDPVSTPEAVSYTPATADVSYCTLSAILDRIDRVLPKLP